MNSQSNQNSKEYIFPRFYAVVDTVKDRPKLVNEAKKKLGLSGGQLKGCY